MNTVIRNPPTRLPWPPIPFRLNQPDVIGTVPAWCPSTQVRPQTARTMRIRYSMTQMTTWVGAEIRIPITEMIAFTTTRPVAIATFGHLLSDGWLNTDRTEGPIAVTGVRVPNRVPASISHPVR